MIASKSRPISEMSSVKTIISPGKNIASSHIDASQVVFRLKTSYCERTTYKYSIAKTMKSNKEKYFYDKVIKSDKQCDKVNTKYHKNSALKQTYAYDKSFRLQNGLHLSKRTVVLVCLSILVPLCYANTPPRFLLDGESEIVLRLREGPLTPVGSVLYRLRGFDADGDRLTFSIRGQVASRLLQINRVSDTEANLLLKQELDRETVDEYSVTLLLTDGRLNDHYVSQSMLILVDDVNDNSPVFAAHETSVKISENSDVPVVLAVLEATDRDQGPFGQVVYSLRTLDTDLPQGTFSVSTEKGRGVLRLHAPLDYEKRPFYQVQMLATDRAALSPHTATAALLITVEDVSDADVEFVYVPHLVRIPENTRPGTEIANVIATDGDRGVNADIVYTLLDNGDDSFRVDSTSGIIYTASVLDREARLDTNGAIILTIAAQEANLSIAGAKISTEITVLLTDINDQIPRFTSDIYRAVLRENSQQGLPVTFETVTPPIVSDLDQGKNGSFRLYLEGDDGVFEVTPPEVVNMAEFMIRVKNSAAIDYERVKGYNFTIVAEETNLVLVRRSRAQILVQVSDENDNTPVFQQEIYQADAPENVQAGVVLVNISALDADTGRFGTEGIRYINITGDISNSLSLDPMTGVVTIKSNVHGLNREKQTEHSLTIIASDDLGRGHRSNVGFVLRVTDINDNVPICDLDSGHSRVTLLENSNSFANAQPVFIRAYDLDDPDTPNAKLSYHLIGAALDHFTINANNGQVSIWSPLDYESLQGYDEMRSFNVSAAVSDNGTPSLSTTCTISVLVRDENDNAPIFEKTQYKATLSEDAPGGSKVTQVFATDSDGSLQYSSLVYRIQYGARDKFVVDPTTGVISVSQGASLDPDLSRPRALFYNLSVVAMDSGVGEEQLSGRTTVLITVEDINNKPPVFEEPGEVSVAENARVGTVVAKLKAHDPDSNPVLRYSLDYNTGEAINELGAVVQPSEYNFTSAFRVHPIEGVVRTARLLDREAVSTIRIVVNVQDLAAVNSRQSATATLTVKLQDLNDNDPVFRQNYYRQAVAENAKVGTPIVRVLADDADLNRTIQYTLQGGKDIIDLVFLDANSGEIVVGKPIDYELHHWLNFSVRAMDNGLPSRHALTDVFVQVLDENDNNPKFVDDVTTVTVRENAPIDTVIAQVEATDDDSAEYGQPTYLLDRLSADGKFAIDPDTGEIRVSGKLNRELQSDYLLVLQAWDNYQYGGGADQSRNTFKHITVTISDVNDESPQIRLPESCFSVTEFIDPTDVIGQLVAEDEDDPDSPNSWVNFTIAAGNDQGIFSLLPVDNNTVNIVATQSLVGLHGNYSLRIESRDQGYPVNMDDQIVPICVTDFNDHAPVFVQPPANVTLRVPENETVGSVLAVLSAVDNDIGANAAVRYRMLPDRLNGFSSFHLDSVTGQLLLKKQLDREQQKLYKIRVEAYDLGSPTSLSSDRDLTIYVSDVNDHKPKFLVDSVTLNFTENQEPGHESRILPETVDADLVDDLEYLEENELESTVCYFIVDGNEDNKFKVDLLQRNLTTTISLDREERAIYELVVMATDDCLTPPPSHVMFDPENDSLLKVIVNVGDLNDNGPKFERALFSGGVSTDTHYGTEVVALQAFDPDCCENAQLEYAIKGVIEKTLSEGLDVIGLHPFLLNSTTGVITLNFDPQQNMKGYFDFSVTVRDSSGAEDESHVFIYLLRNDQRIRFVLRMSPQEARQKSDTLRDALGSISDTIVNIDQFSAHSSRHGTVDRTLTDLYMHFVNKEDNSILDVPTALAMLDSKVDSLDPIFKEFNVLSTQAAEENIIGIAETNTAVISWLIGCCLFLILLLVTVLSLCANQRKKYRRMLRATTTAAFGSSGSTNVSQHTLVPNTNIHALEGSNPVWLTGRAPGQGGNIGHDHDWPVHKETLSEFDLSPDGRNGVDYDNFADRMDSLDDNALNLPSFIGLDTERHSKRSAHCNTGRSSTNESKLQNFESNKLSPSNDRNGASRDFTRNVFARNTHESATVH